MASQAANLWVLLGLGLAGILLMTRKLKKAIREDFGAFVERLQLLPSPQPAPPKAPHPSPASPSLSSTAQSFRSQAHAMAGSWKARESLIVLAIVTFGCLFAFSIAKEEATKLGTVGKRTPPEIQLEA
ncbi:hypothetical protein C1H46_025449 [Malus baccata]|uniref:Uncharacterized protein n=1 Tax=Malus baccata TaxID=106549 RepID=A0A540LRL5_MALBA|nr:hypothetical protein C1H46_025449 [Malus baccata]